MISAIFKHFQAILSKSLLEADIFLRALSNRFFKYKIPLGYPKILIIVGLNHHLNSPNYKAIFHVHVSRHENQNKKSKNWRYIYRKFGITQRINIEDTKERSQIRVMKLKKVTYGEALGRQSHFIFRI